jgi:hypothetical protein
MLIDASQKETAIDKQQQSREMLYFSVIKHYYGFFSVLPR